MKVLFINTVFGKGSTGKIVHDIGEILEKNGHEYVALYGRAPISNDKHAIFIGNKYDARIHAGMSRITDGCGRYSKCATKKIIKFIKEYRPDVIHLHNLHGYYINLEVLFEYLKNEFSGKVIWTLHDCWAFTGHCVHYTFAKCDRWKTHCFNCPEKKRYPSSLVFDASKANYDRKKKWFCGVDNLTIVTPSEWLKKQVEDSFLKVYSCKVINNGIDLNVFKPQSFHNDKPYVLNVVDGLDERKGLSDLLKISQSVSDIYDILLIGVSESEKDKVAEDIKAICRTNSQEELINYYSAATYFINTTYEDTFPTVNIEALACGTPVITYKSGGSPEIIDNTSGYSVDVGDYQAIITLLRKPRTISDDDCRTRALQFDKWTKYKQYMELYLN